MKALISTVETVLTGYRVAQVEQDSNIFPVAEDLFWTDCSDDCVADQFWYDTTDKTVKPIPVEVGPQPTVIGAEQL